MTTDALQALACAEMEDKEVMLNLTIINLTLYQILNQAQEKILVLSKQLQDLQAQLKKNKPTTEKLVIEKKTRDKKSKSYCWTHGRTRGIEHTRPDWQ